METSYTSDINFFNQEIEHTSSLENGFMPVETVREDILKNLYRAWGSKPLEHVFNEKTVQFYLDLMFEGITSDEYMEYARKQNKEEKVNE